MNTLNRLISALRCLPGVGPKSAQRMAYYLLQHQRERGFHLSECLDEAMKKIHHCDLCNNFAEDSLCTLCQNQSRDPSLLCIVEGPADILAIEQSNIYRGTYFVLMGKISPLDGMGPDDIHLPKLATLIQKKPIKEVILALSPTVEGQTTAHFIQELLNQHAIRITQLAHGIPSGGELEFLDSKTISCALQNRAIINA
jgi:recombination protein RecR